MYPREGTYKWRRRRRCALAAPGLRLETKATNNSSCVAHHIGERRAPQRRADASSTPTHHAARKDGFVSSCARAHSSRHRVGRQRPRRHLLLLHFLRTLPGTTRRYVWMRWSPQLRRARPVLRVDRRSALRIRIHTASSIVSMATFVHTCLQCLPACSREACLRC